MIKKIKVTSKSQAKAFISDVPWAAISITTYKDDWPKLNGTKRLGLLQLWFADVELEYYSLADEILFKPEHAKQIYDFVKSMHEKNDVELLLVHCEAGYSRSPAIACVLEQAFLGLESKLFPAKYFNSFEGGYLKYEPNKLVHKIMIQEGIRLGHLKYSDEFQPFVTPE